MHLGFTSMNTPADLHPADLARALEARGFESLWFGEHSHIPCSRRTPYPGGGDLPAAYCEMMDPYLSLMAAASATSSLKLGTGVALLMERELFSQAKTIATLDRLSGGRALVGVGVGWNQEEFSNASRHPFGKRYAVLRETVAATRALWTEEAPEYHGDYVDFDPVWANPKPVQPGGPPIYLGAMGPLGVRHAARWADGWYPVDIALPDVAQAVADFRRQVEEAGRAPGSVAINLQIMDTDNLERLKRYRDLGVERATFGVSTDLWDKPEAMLPLIDRIAALIPALQ